MKTKLLLPAVLLCTGLACAQVIDLEVVSDDFNLPIEITNAGDERLFVVEQGGLIRILNPDGEVNETPFLNVGNLISTGFERGLLGLAFHPDYTENGYFFINYTNTAGNTVVARYSVQAGNPDQADAGSGFPIITINQPQPNHNGGTLRFGPDGYLYIGMGDGGGQNDPNGNGQNTTILLAKMLRIDVDTDGDEPYEIPADNPFAGVEGADEIWAYGLRNPWKFSFDSATGDLWIADVGQNLYEEINMAGPAAAGINYGWRCYEGNDEFNMEGCSDTATYTMPISGYSQSDGRCSITGGYVYRGTSYPNLQGKYIFGDWCTGEVGILDGGNITFSGFEDNIYTFGQDVDGELYVGGNNTIYRLVDTALSTGDFSKMPFAIYPNPAENEVFIDLKEMSNAAVTIYDISGKLLASQAVSAGNSRIDASALQAGIYALSVETGSGSHTQKLIIK